MQGLINRTTSNLTYMNIDKTKELVIASGPKVSSDLPLSRLTTFVWKLSQVSSTWGRFSTKNSPSMTTPTILQKGHNKDYIFLGNSNRFMLVKMYFKWCTGPSLRVFWLLTSFYGMAIWPSKAEASFLVLWVWRRKWSAVDKILC